MFWVDGYRRQSSPSEQFAALEGHLEATGLFYRTGRAIIKCHE